MLIPANWRMVRLYRKTLFGVLYILYLRITQKIIVFHGSRQLARRAETLDKRPVYPLDLKANYAQHRPAMRPPKRLALILPRLSRYGGVEQFAWRLAEAAARAGHEVSVICARQETEPPPGVKVVEVGRPGPFKVIKLLWFVLMAERARRTGDYDLSMAFGPAWQQDILRVGGGPLLAFWRLSSQSWPAGFSRCFKQLRRRLSPVNWLTLYLEQRQYRQTKTIVCVSDTVRQWTREVYPQANPLVIYNKPDLSRFVPASAEQRQAARDKFGLNQDDLVISTASSNFALKGLGPLLRALALLPDKTRLLVAGQRDPSRYLALAEHLGLAGRVSFLGRVDNMVEVYQASDIFALPTFYDACSNAVLEALACGLKTLSSRCNGSSIFLPAAWVLDDPADWRDMAARLARMLNEPGPLAWPDTSGLKSGLEAWLALIDATLPPNPLLSKKFNK